MPMKHMKGQGVKLGAVLPACGFSGNREPPIRGTDLLPFNHLPPIKKSKRPANFSACLRQLDVLLIGFSLLSFWWRLDFGLSCIPGFCSDQRLKGGRENVEGRRDPGAGNHLSCAYKSVPLVSEHAHWGTLGSHQIQPPNLNWREGKLRRWLLCCCTLSVWLPPCVAPSAPMALRLKGDRGLLWKRWTALTGSHVRWVRAFFLSYCFFCPCTVSVKPGKASSEI